MGVQEGDDVPDGHGGSQHAGPDQPFPLLGAQDPHVGELRHVILQALLQVLCVKRRHVGTNNSLKTLLCLYQKEMALEVWPERVTNAVTRKRK